MYICVRCHMLIDQRTERNSSTANVRSNQSMSLQQDVIEGWAADGYWNTSTRQPFIFGGDRVCTDSPGVFVHILTFTG